MTESIRYTIHQNSLPADFPTHRNTTVFWEKLGRTVATFGMLEDILCKAIFAFTASKSYSNSEVREAYEQWITKLQKTLSDPLGGLIDTYGKAVRDHPDAITSISKRGLTELLDNMRVASKIRNTLCHGSWPPPDQNGASIPFFVTTQGECFETPINDQWLDQTRQHVVELICAVINTVTQMGWQFPGSVGPGAPIWKSSTA